VTKQQRARLQWAAFIAIMAASTGLYFAGVAGDTFAISGLLALTAAAMAVALWVS
jgi:hypothetical protein